MKLSEVKQALSAMYRAPVRRPIYLSGPPGIGKTAAPEQVARELGIGCIILQATNEDPITLSGLPARAKDSEHAVFLAFKDKLPVDGSGILVIDELPSAPPAVQVGFNGLFLAGQLGSYRLPAGWYVCATGNRVTDRAGANRIPTPVQSRIVECSIEPYLHDWCGWAFGAGIKEEIIAFLNFRTAQPADGIDNIFMNFDASRPGAFACPRTWHMASDVMKLAMPPMIERTMLAGCVGQGPATELSAFVGIYRSLVSPDLVLMHPDTAAIPDKPDALYAVCGALAFKATATNLDRVMTYADRLPPEYSAVLVHQMTRRNPALQHEPGFRRWAHQYTHLLS